MSNYPAWEELSDTEGEIADAYRALKAEADRLGREREEAVDELVRCRATFRYTFRKDVAAQSAVESINITLRKINEESGDNAGGG